MKFFKSILFILVFSFVYAKAKPEIIKFATLAPQKTQWMQTMEQFASRVEAETKGEVKFKIYAGGVHGDEKSVVRKILTGQLHSGGFTGVGIGIIAPGLRVLDAPFLFSLHKEIDYISDKFESEFRKLLSDRGFVLLGWAEVGFVYLFTNKPITKPADLSGVKMWLWEGDPIAESTFKNLQISAIPLSITDVSTSLETGLVDGVYGSTMSVIAMQWFGKVKYMLDLPIANASGAVLISKEKFDKLKPEYQKIILNLGKKYFADLTSITRAKNKEALTVLKENNITVTKPENEKIKQEFLSAGRKARLELAGRIYSEALLAEVEKSLAEFRGCP